MRACVRGCVSCCCLASMVSSGRGWLVLSLSVVSGVSGEVGRSLVSVVAVVLRHHFVAVSCCVVVPRSLGSVLFCPAPQGWLSLPVALCRPTVCHARTEGVWCRVGRSIDRPGGSTSLLFVVVVGGRFVVGWFCLTVGIDRRMDRRMDCVERRSCTSIHAFTHSLAPRVACWMAPTNPANHLPIHPSTHSFVRSCVRAFVRSLVRWFVRWFVGSLVGSLVRWFVGSLVRSFVWLFVGC
mgnify:CR=1 FL=1